MKQGESTRDMLARMKSDAQKLESQTAATETQTKVQQPWSPQLVQYLSTSILLFGLGVMLIMGWLVVRRGITQGVLRLICVPLIVVAAVFLMVVGYDDQQLTPIVGLLGTIAGYLLGKTEPTPPPGVPPRSKEDEGEAEGAESSTQTRRISAAPPIS